MARHDGDAVPTGAFDPLRMTTTDAQSANFLHFASRRRWEDISRAIGTDADKVARGLNPWPSSISGEDYIRAFRDLITDAVSVYVDPTARLLSEYLVIIQRPWTRLGGLRPRRNPYFPWYDAGIRRAVWSVGKRSGDQEIEQAIFGREGLMSRIVTGTSLGCTNREVDLVGHPALEEFVARNPLIDIELPGGFDPADLASLRRVFFLQAADAGDERRLRARYGRDGYAFLSESLVRALDQRSLGWDSWSLSTIVRVMGQDAEEEEATIWISENPGHVPHDPENQPYFATVCPSDGNQRGV